MNSKELIDNMAKDALNYVDTNIVIHREELTNPIVFNKLMIKFYSFTTICFEVLIYRFREHITDEKDTIYLYDIMNAKRRFNSVMEEAENRLIYAKLQEERRESNESDTGCETQSPE